MTAFEYITIPVSIVLALGLGKVLSAVMVVFETGKRDWLHLLWCFVLILVMLAQWVAVWSLGSNQSWSAAEFFLVMISPILFYSAAHLLISSRPESVESWSSHMERIARPFLLLMLLSVGNFGLRTYVILDASPDTAPSPLFPLLLITINVAALIYPKRGFLAASALVWLAPVLGVLYGVKLD